MRIEKVTKNTVVRQVMEQLKTLIATGELKPGDKIPTENMLAEQFGTAMMPFCAHRLRVW